MTTSLIALGGGRVIDTAKALGAATGRAVAAVPTTLSAAEMTHVHRGRRPAWTRRPSESARAWSSTTRRCRPLSHCPELAASAANSLGHAVEGAVTTLASPRPGAGLPRGRRA